MVMDSITSEWEMFSTLCNPGIEIEHGAMATHHITPEMIMGKPQLTDTSIYKKLLELNAEDNIMVIHNSKFDLEMLAKEGFKRETQLIDTLTTAKHLYPLSERHAMQYLRYSLDIYKNEEPEFTKTGVEVKAHSAEGDVIVLAGLYNHMLEANSNKKLIDLTKKTPLIMRMPFGKYRGTLTEEVVTSDLQYVNWMLKKMSDLSEDMRYTLNYYLTQRLKKITGRD